MTYSLETPCYNCAKKEEYTDEGEIKKKIK